MTEVESGLLGVLPLPHQVKKQKNKVFPRYHIS